MPKNLLPCPCCGFLVCEEPPGSYEICPVCGWENDGVQARAPGYRGGANEESLCEAQAVLLTRVAADVLLHEGFRRARDWRPLTAQDCTTYDTADTDGNVSPYYWEQRREP